MHRATHWLVLTHRWIGIVTCLLFLMWCATGMVMVFVPTPKLSDAERLIGLPPIDWSKVRVGPADAERLATPTAPASSTVLEMAGSDPVWRVTLADDAPVTAAATNGRVNPSSGAQVTISAQTGERLTFFDANQAERIATAFARTSARKVDTIESDDWTYQDRYAAHRPLYRVRLSGDDGRDLYVSGTSGAVMLDTNDNERFWNAFGSTPHWLYYGALSRNDDLWRKVLMWVAGPCIFGALSGMWLGIMRTRIGARRYKDGRITPYRGWMFYHHIAGLTGGTMLTLWIFSGWMFLDPGHLFKSPGITPNAYAGYLAASSLPQTDPRRLAEAAGGDAKRVEFFWSAGRPWVEIDGEKQSATLDASSLKSVSIGQDELLVAAQKLIPDASIASVTRLTTPDFYWYDLYAPAHLPVLRIKLADEASTWLHVDSETGRLLGIADGRARIYRWLYSVFHKWDLNVLFQYRHAWEVFMLTFASIGLATSISAIWIGWRRLRSHALTRIDNVTEEKA